MTVGASHRGSRRCAIVDILPSDADVISIDAVYSVQGLVVTRTLRLAGSTIISRDDHELVDIHEQRWTTDHRHWYGDGGGGRPGRTRRGLPRRASGAPGYLPQTTLLLRESELLGDERARNARAVDGEYNDLARFQNQKDSAELSSDLLEGENIAGLGLDAWESEEWLAGAER